MSAIFYQIHEEVFAFTAGKGCHGTEPGVDAREAGVTFPASSVDELNSQSIFIPRQTHSLNVCWAEGPGECPDTDAVITKVKGLCVAVKTADCIPVLLYDKRQQLVAAIHAGWRGTVGRIVSRTIEEMKSRGEDLQAVIGPGISLDSFEVGDEVYEAFQEAGFPMERIAKRYPVLNPQLSTHNSQLSTTLNSTLYTLNSHPSTLNSQLSTTLNSTLYTLNSHPSTLNSQLSTTLNSKLSTLHSEKWHLDLWCANRWLLEQCGVTDIQVAGIDTMSSADFYSARRETIKTGRNINGIMLVE